MEETGLISLYDYLGYAAGTQLGKEVATAATEAKEKIGRRFVTNTRYKGEVMLYRREFLKEYFTDKQKSNTEPTLGDRQSYQL
jgi:hypothetical protein